MRQSATAGSIHRLINRVIPVTRAGHSDPGLHICETKTIDSRLQLLEKAGRLQRERERGQIDDESISLVCTPRRPPVKADTSITFDRFREIYVRLSASNFGFRSLRDLIFVPLLFSGYGTRLQPNHGRHHSIIVKPQYYKWFDNISLWNSGVWLALTFDSLKECFRSSPFFPRSPTCSMHSYGMPVALLLPDCFSKSAIVIKARYHSYVRQIIWLTRSRNGGDAIGSRKDSNLSGRNELRHASLLLHTLSEILCRRSNITRARGWILSLVARIRALFKS